MMNADPFVWAMIAVGLIAFVFFVALVNFMYGG